MDAVTRINYYFPTHALTSFWIVTNLFINNVGKCSKGVQQLVTAILIIWCLIVILSSFTDTYTDANGVKHWVYLVPCYGPLCFGLTTDDDKDRVWDGFYIKIRDYMRALLGVATFLLISLFCNPLCMCLFPSGFGDGTSYFASSVVRTVPIVVAIVMALVMICLGPPRQMLGSSNVPEAIPLLPMEHSSSEYPANKGGGSLPDDSGIEMGDHELQPDTSSYYNDGNNTNSNNVRRSASAAPYNAGAGKATPFGGILAQSGQDTGRQGNGGGGGGGGGGAGRDSYRASNGNAQMAPSPSRGGNGGGGGQGYDQGYRDGGQP